MSTHMDTASELESLIEFWRRSFSNLKLRLHMRSQRRIVGQFQKLLATSSILLVTITKDLSEPSTARNWFFPKYDQNEWVAAANYRACDWQSLVELWYFYNRQIVVLIRNMRPSSLSTPCTITPYETCTLGFLVADYLDHMKHHFKYWPIAALRQALPKNANVRIAAIGSKLRSSGSA